MKHSHPSLRQYTQVDSLLQLICEILFDYYVLIIIISLVY